MKANNVNYSYPLCRITAPLRRKRREHPLQIARSLRIQRSRSRNRTSLPPIGAHEATLRRGTPSQVSAGVAGSQQSPPRRLFHTYAKIPHLIESLR